MSNNKNVFAILGGGSTGPLQLITIALEAQKKGKRLDGKEFHLIDPNGFGNGGIAYGHSLQGHKLNSTADEMDPHAPGSFQKKLNAENISADPSCFNDRADYQPFIREHMVDEAIAILESLGARVKEHRTLGFVKAESDGSFSLVSTDPTDNKVRPELIDPDLANLSASNFVLTPGYGPNTNFSNLWDSEGYIHSPYDKERRSLELREPRLKNEHVRVAVIGSGPGLYDVANNLSVKPKEFLVFSRSGKPLEVRDTSIEAGEISIPPHALLALNRSATLDDAKAALKAEFNDAGLVQGRSNRRIALDINKHLKQILINLNTETAIAFRQSAELCEIKHLSTPIPQESHDRIRELDAKFHAACLNGNISPRTEGGFNIQIGDTAFTTDVIINATGHGRHNSAVIESLKKQGLAKVEQKTGALATADEAGYRLAGSDIAVIGPATHVGTDGMESHYIYVKDLAEKFVADIDDTAQSFPLAPPSTSHTLDLRPYR